jgi:hypothetical protein
MCFRAVWGVLVLAALLTDGGVLLAQFPQSQAIPPAQLGAASEQSRFGGIAPAVAQRGSPVQALETITGEQINEPGGERRREGESEREAEPDEIETDRDSFTPATTLAGRGRTIVESAYSFIDNRRVKETHSVPELIMRYGLTERVELRLGWNYEVGGAGNATSGSDVSDVSDQAATGTRSRVLREYTLTYGLKFQVTKQDRWLPQSIFIVQAFTPTGGSSGTSTATDFVATYAAGWVFPNRWKFDVAMRYGTSSEEGDHFNQWSPSAVIKVPIGEKWAGHIEYFGTFTSGKEKNFNKQFISPGLHYLITPDLEVGFRLGWGLNDQSARFFSNVGFGWRF